MGRGKKKRTEPLSSIPISIQGKVVASRKTGFWKETSSLAANIPLRRDIRWQFPSFLIDLFCLLICQKKAANATGMCVCLSVLKDTVQLNILGTETRGRERDRGRQKKVWFLVQYEKQITKFRQKCHEIGKPKVSMYLFILYS